MADTELESNLAPTLAPYYDLETGEMLTDFDPYPQQIAVYLSTKSTDVDVDVQP